MNLSFSQIKTANLCGFKYKKLYIEKIKQPPIPAAVFGSALHSLFEHFIAKKITKEQCKELWKSYLDETIKEDGLQVLEGYNTWLSKGYSAITIFLETQVWLDIKEVIRTEEKMYIEMDGRKWVFICDLVYKNSRQQTVLLDYKSGRRRDEDFCQLAFYNKLLNGTNDKISIFYLFEGVEEVDLNQWNKKSEEFVNKGLDIIENKKFSRKPNKWCKNCAFYKTDCEYILKN